MRQMPTGPLGLRSVLGVTCCAYVLSGAYFGVVGKAAQLRSVAEGVYSAAQAARGQQIYQAQCADCHGNALEGASGPPLGRREFPLQLERASAGDSRRQDSKDDAFRSCRESFASAIDGPHGVHSSSREVPRRTVRAERRRVGAGCIPRSPHRSRASGGCFWNGVVGAAGGKSGRVDESHCVSQLEHHLQRADSRPRRTDRKRSWRPHRLTISRGDPRFIQDGWLSIKPLLHSPRRPRCY